MAKNWIKGAIKHPGALKAKAQKAGESTRDYAKQHAGDGGQTGRQARLDADAQGRQGHPLPFRPVARLTDADPTGAILLDLAAAGIAVWSSHTAWDSAAGGINDQLAERAGLTAVSPLTPDPAAPRAGARKGALHGVATTVARMPVKNEPA